MNHDCSKAEAWNAVLKGLPYASGRKDPEKARGFNSEYQEHGIYRDAVIIHDGKATWAYHGTPIVQRDMATGKISYSTQGWDTKTTIDRLRYAGACLYRHKGKSYCVSPYGKPMKEIREHPEWAWKNDEIIPPQDLHHRIDAWRGYSVPVTAIAGASNTGSWSDSPCRPEEELQRFRDFLSASGVKSTLCWTETSNIFCIKQWVQVHPKYRDKAIELTRDFLQKEETMHLHLAGYE